MKRRFGLILLLTVGASIAFAQPPTINGDFALVNNDGIEYAVKVRIWLDSDSAELGFATIFFGFNNSDLSFPATPDSGTDYEIHEFNTSSYQTPTVTRAFPDTVSINIEYNTGTGTFVKDDTLDVATIRFSVLNPDGYPTLVWSSSTIEIYGTDFAQWNLGVWSDRDDHPLPIQLSSFVANVVAQGRVDLEWLTLSEINNYGFYVERRASGEKNFAEIPQGFVPGHGTTQEPQRYTFTDYPPGTGVYFYRLRQVDLDGSFHYTGVVQTGTITSVSDLAPVEFRLFQNYPNPFNPETVIKFSVETPERTTLYVYNIIGQRVMTLFDDIAETGRYYSVKLNGADLASGVYFYGLQSGKKSDLKKMLLLK